jgi:7,8-dihydroneopterin 2',3'-cyclic phosphate phosphodiesterase
MCLKELTSLVNSIRKESYRSVVTSILSDPKLSFTDAKPLIDVCQSPAAPRKHHFYSGGLVLHTLSVALVALRIAEVFREVYGVSIDDDLVIATAILHDIFKYYQYAPDPVNGGYRARDDWYLSHDYAVVAELARRGAPDELIRAVTEVHGLVPFTTLEGLIVHLADATDARFGEYLQNVLLSKIRDVEKEGCTTYKVLDELIKRRGIKEVARLLSQGADKLVEEARNICRELKASTTQVSSSTGSVGASS